MIKKLLIPQLRKGIVVILSALVFVLINLVVSRFNLRLDLSRGKAYSLSPATKKVLKRVDDVLRIKFYVSSNLPRKLMPVRDSIWNFLKEYEKENKNVEIYMSFPDKDSKAMDEVKAAGLPELQFSELETSKLALTKSYFGIVVYYLDKSEVIPQVADFENLEYELTTAIYRLTVKQLPKVAVLGYNNPFMERNSSVSLFHRYFVKQFQLNYVEPKDLNKDYKLLVVFDNREREYSTDEAKIIDNYLMQGNKGIFFVDGVWVKDDLSYSSANHNLFSLLEKRGIVVNKNLVLSQAAEIVSFGNNYIAYFAPYPLWLKTNVVNAKSGYSSGVSTLFFPWTSSLQLSNKNGYETQWLVKTIDKSWEQKDPFQLIPDNITLPSKGFKEFVIAAESKGKNGEQIVVIASSRFVLDRFVQRADNLNFVSNIALAFASDGLLSGIRIKKPSFYLIPSLTNSQKEILKYLSIFTLPVLYLVFGLIRVLRRR